MALDLVAPIIPNGNDSKGPELFLQGAQIGLAGALRMSEQRRQSEIEMARLAEHERVSQEAHDLELKKMEAEVPLREAHVRYYDALTNYQTAHAKSFADQTATAAQRAIRHNEEVQSLLTDFNKRADELGVTDPKAISEDPVKFSMGLMNLQDEFRGANWIPQVRQSLRQLQLVADQQKVQFGEDPKRPTQSVMKIVQALTSTDPDVKQAAIDGLKAGGHFKSETVPGVPTQDWTHHPIDTMWDKLIGPKDTSVEKPDATAKQLMEGAQKFERTPTRVPYGMMPDQTTGPTQLPEPDLPPDTTGQPQANVNPAFQPTETDAILGHAKAALAQGASRDAVLARLQQLGIDPGDLAA